MPLGFRIQDMKYVPARPPANTLFVDSWADLMVGTDPASYIVFDENGNNRCIVLKGHNRQVLEALMRQPVCAASRCRISEKVRHLKRDLGIAIATNGYQPKSDGEKFGVYTLEARVHRAGGDA